MISSKAKQIRERLLEFCTLMEFQYNGIDCNIDPFNEAHFHVMCADTEHDVGSIEDIMNLPLFCGACLNDIAEDITIIDW